MRGGKRPFNSGRRGGPPFKKKKRSKKFWQQRQTSQIEPAPVEEEHNHSTSDEEDGNEDKNSYEALLETFSTSKAASNDEDSETSSDAQSDTRGEENDCEETKDEEEEKDDDSVKSDDESDPGEEDETNLAGDPFHARLEGEIPEEMVKKIKDKDMTKFNVSWRSLGKLLVQHPKWKMNKAGKQRGLLGDDDEEEVWQRQCLESQEKLINANLAEPMKDFFLIPELENNLAAANVKNLGDLRQPLTSLQTEILSLLTSYKDVYCSEESSENLEQIRLVYVVHTLNHVLKTRKQILKNGKKLSKDGAAAKHVRDQGLCRPKVLIVVPFKESARRVVDLMGKLLFGQVKGGNVSNKKRFDEDFGSGEPKGLGKMKASGKKPDDFYDTFCGDTDDAFKIGLAVTKKTLKLYSDFYSSDVILASPLGLRMVIGVDGEAKRDFDFLSSVEMVIMDQMEILAMQNWDHISHIVEHLNLQPSQSRGVDFSRVRMWSLNGLSKNYRQTLLFSSVCMPEANAILSKDCGNYCGSVRVVNPSPIGTICSISTRVPVVFHRFETSSISRGVDDRFDYFVNRIMPEFQKDLMYHTLIFVPSYFDYVRVRNWCNGSDLDFGEISEYSKEKKVAMSRDLFFHGEKHFLLYSERAHFYRRYAIKGIRHLIFYQLPHFPKYFSELCNFMHFQNKKGGSDGNMSCTVLYCKYDIQRLAPVVSTDRAATMLSADAKSVHMFSPGQE